MEQLTDQLLFCKIKICCIKSIEEAQLAIDHGADVLGFVGPMPSGPGIIDDLLINTIATSVPKSIETFLLTSETTADAIIEHYRKVNTTAIQMVDAVDIDEYLKIRKALPHIKLVQVIHVLDEQSIKEALVASAHVDALLLDSGNPNFVIKQFGGTGRRHDWRISKQIVELVDIPVFLAGGLNSDNVQEAIEVVRPFGLDLCSGVRINGSLDEEKLKTFIDLARKLT